MTVAEIRSALGGLLSPGELETMHPISRPMLARLIEVRDGLEVGSVGANDPRVLAIHDSMPGSPVSKFVHRVKAGRPKTMTGPTWHELERLKVRSPDSIDSSARFRERFHELIVDFDLAHGSASGTGGFDFRLWEQDTLRWLQEHGL